jgi:exodeoxyribonuclease V alpha subunit
MLKVMFPRRNRCIVAAIDRLGRLDVAFALTVHKSQGSEFHNVLLVLPEYASALLTRQIVYTGITRARSAITMYETQAILARAIETREERAGGVVIG